MGACSLCCPMLVPARVCANNAQPSDEEPILDNEELPDTADSSAAVGERDELAEDSSHLEDAPMGEEAEESEDVEVMRTAEEASSTEAAEGDEGAAGQAQGVAMEEAEEEEEEDPCLSEV